MYRKYINHLNEWKNKNNRKPLIIWGARQVGKTWLMKEFGRQAFENIVYISFYNNSKYAQIFEEDYDVKRIIENIEVFSHQNIKPKTTLLIFDEVQSAPRVVEALKYFCEDAPEYVVIAAGSLLGVAIHEGVSFPVGKVDELHMYPMDFVEFLMACDEEKLANIVANGEFEKANQYAERYKEFLRLYYIVGGMPEVVSTYIANKDFDEVRELQNNIIRQYEGDFGKHVKETELPRIRMVWAALPMQLAKENRKFFFGQVKKGARFKDFEIAIQWLEDAGLIYKVHKVSKPGMPLKSYIDLTAFKIYALDIGLLGAMSELDISSVLYGNGIFEEFKGALTEQYVLQQLVQATEYTPYYYAGEKSTYEIDFLIQKKKLIVPIEVKAEENLKAKSLKCYCDKFQSEYAIRTSMSNYREQDWMRNLPLWMIQDI